MNPSRISVRKEILRVVTTFYEGCNEGNPEKIAACLSAEAVHYFPVGAPQQIFKSPTDLIRGWQEAIRQFDSRWSLDRVVIDVDLREAAIEWTHFKPNVGGLVRGAELCRFDDALRIAEIRPYYAVPAPSADGRYELGEFDYADRGYATIAPDVVRRM